MEYIIRMKLETLTSSIAPAQVKSALDSLYDIVIRFWNILWIAQSYLDFGKVFNKVNHGTWPDV